MTEPTMQQTSQCKLLTLEEKLDMILAQQNMIVNILGEVKFYGVSKREKQLLSLRYKKLKKVNEKLLEDRRQVNEAKKDINE